MAVPIEFRKPETDPRAELMRKVECAPQDHAEALLVAWATLQTAHDKGILDLLQGMMSGRDIVATEFGKAMKSPDMVRLVRNGIALGGMLASLDPETLTRLSKGLNDSLSEPPEKEAPSLWKLTKRLFSEDARRGMAFGIRLLTGLGRATKPAK